jgi:hypothetical protein
MSATANEAKQAKGGEAYREAKKALRMADEGDPQINNSTPDGKGDSYEEFTLLAQQFESCISIDPRNDGK